MPAPFVALLAEPIMGVVNQLIDRAFPDSAARELKRLEYSAKITEAITRIDMAQIEVNKQEAAHSDIFVAGWRPFIGWVCGFAFAYHYIVQPMLAFTAATLGHDIDLPEFDMEAMMYVLGGMLGLGTMRSYEKNKGVATGISDQLPWRKGKTNGQV